MKQSISVKMKQEDRILDRQRKVWAERLTGKNYQAIADALGISMGTVCSDLKTVREGIENENAERAKEEKEIERARLDAIVETYMNKIMTGTASNSDVSTYIKVSERRAKMLGLDAAIASKTELSGPDGMPLQLASGYDAIQARMIEAGWQPPKNEEVLPGLPKPNQLENSESEDGFEVETIVVDK